MSFKSIIPFDFHKHSYEARHVSIKKDTGLKTLRKLPTATQLGGGGGRLKAKLCN